MKKRTKKEILFIAIICAVTLLGLLKGHADAATYYVPDDFPSIQEAINASTTGDIILVRPGTYFEHLYINKSITIQSTDGPESTIIDGSNSGRPVTCISSLVMNGFTITNGNAGSGGGIYIGWRIQPQFHNCVITGNRASVGGGVYFCCYTGGYFANCVISNNTAIWGGGIYTNFGGPTLVNSIITGNSVSGNGGGIVVGYGGNINAFNSTITDNHAAGSGGGVYLSYTYHRFGFGLRATNLIIARNSARVGGGIFVDYNGAVWLWNSTVTGNVATTGGGIYYSSSAGLVYSLNSIIHLNSTPPIITGANVSIAYSDIEGSCAGDGNIDADPLFRDYLNGDYHLQQSSPCIDAGLNYALPGTDYDGNPRVVDGNDDGVAIVDMGAFEFQKCIQVPEFEITSFGTEYIWPPNRKMKEVTVSGKVLLPAGCTLLGADYSIDDEYGIYSSEGELAVADGNFTLSFQVEPWRDGGDIDGRHYGISLFAKDEAGVGSEAFKVLVPHDQRKQ